MPGQTSGARDATRSKQRHSGAHNHQAATTGETTTSTTTMMKTTMTISATDRLLRRRLMILAVVVVACCPSAQRLVPVRAFFIDQRQSPHTSEWTYGAQTQWSQQYRECSGRAQSPIDIQQRNVISNQHLRLQFYNYQKPLKFKLSNAHHTIKMNPVGIPAYDNAQERHYSGGVKGGGHPLRVNYSGSLPPHDIITAEDFSSVAHGSGGGGGAGGHVGENEQLSRLVQRGPSSGPAGPANGERGQATHQQLRHQQDLKGAGSQGEREHDNSGLEGGNSLLVEPGQNIADERAAANGAQHPSAHEPYEGAPTLRLDWLDDGNNEYKLRDIHFHWAERRDNGSEHAIDGRRAAMEMHLVHIKHGLDKSQIGFTSDSVTVVAVLIESHRKSNADFNPIVNELARINATEQAREIDFKSIDSLLPDNTQAFYTYSGSLTTPPCYQVVNWIVMAERLNMNAKQIEMFRNLYAPPAADDDDDDGAGEHEEQPGLGGNRLAGEGRHDDDAEATARDHQAGHRAAPGGRDQHLELIMPNVRALRPLNNRTILASFTRYGSRLEAASANIYAVSGGSAPSHRLQQQELLLRSPLLLLSLLITFTLLHHDLDPFRSPLRLMAC